MNRRALPLLLALVICFALITPLGYARVSWTWGAGSESGKTLSTAGGKSVYSAVFNINGGDASISVFSFEEAAGDLVKQLTKLFDDASFQSRGGTMAFALLKQDKIVLRFIVLQLSSDASSIVVKIEQSADDYEKSIKPPEEHMLAEVPEFPGSTPVFYAHNKDTDMQIATATTRSGANEINAFYSDMLKTEGWSEPMKDSSSLRLYAKGLNVAMVLAGPPDRTGTRTITLLHKKHGVK